MFSLFATVGTLARVTLNDLPVMKGLTRGHFTASGAVSDKLLEGKNTLTLEVLRMPEEAQLNFEIYALEGDDVENPSQRVVHLRKFEDVQASLAEGVRKVPYWDESTFIIDTQLPEPPYLRAPVMTVPCDGDPELHAAVKALHRAVDRGDVDELCLLMGAQHDHFERAMGGLDGSSRADCEASIHRFFSEKVRVEALDPKALVFTARAGGRVAHVQRADNGPILYAEREDDSTIVFAVRDILLARLTSNAWSVI